MVQESSRPRIGEGRIGSSLCAAIGVLSVAAVLCLRYPAFLTTPELRVHYDVELLRLTLAIAMVVGAYPLDRHHLEGTVYLWLYTHVPLFSIFRDGYKFAALHPLICSFDP